MPVAPGTIVAIVHLDAVTAVHGEVALIALPLATIDKARQVQEPLNVDVLANLASIKCEPEHEFNG